MKQSQLHAIGCGYSRKQRQKLDEELRFACLDAVYEHQAQYESKRGLLQHVDEAKFLIALQEAHDWAEHRRVELSRYNNVSQCKLDEVDKVFNQCEYNFNKLIKNKNLED